MNANPGSGNSSRPSVLLVEDEEIVLETTAAILSERFRVFTAKDASDALDILAREDIDVLCTDYNMPGMTGLELIRRASAMPSHVSSVLVSGFHEFVDEANRSRSELYLLLVKPYAPEKLIDLVAQAHRFTTFKRTLSPKGSPA